MSILTAKQNYDDAVRFFNESPPELFEMANARLTLAGGMMNEEIKHGKKIEPVQPLTWWEKLSR